MLERNYGATLDEMVIALNAPRRRMMSLNESRLGPLHAILDLDEAIKEAERQRNAPTN